MAHSASPGDGLLRPIPLAALGVLILNDHVLKAAFPGLVTGKLSDFAGLIVLPILLIAATEIASSKLGRSWVGSDRLLCASIVLSALAFVAIKAVPAANDAYRMGLGMAQWVVGMPLRIASGDALGTPVPVVLVADVTDLVALIALALAYVDGHARLVKIQTA
jgi:hypothetical protein